MNRVIAAFLSAVLSIAVLLGTAACARPEDGPARIVAEYLGKVIDGDIEGALALDGTLFGRTEVLLSNAAYATAKDRISSSSVVSVKIDGDEAKVRVRTVQKSGTKLTRMALQRHAGQWKLLPASLGTLDVLPGPAGIAPTIGGQSIPEGRRITLRAFPGTYRLTGAPTPDIAVEPADASLVGYGDRSNVAPSVRLSPDATARVTAAALAYLDDCVAQGDRAVWPACPFWADTSEKWWTESRWEIVEPPGFAPFAWEPGCRTAREWATGPGCWRITSEPFGTRFRVSGAGFEDWISEAESSVIDGEVRDPAAPVFRPFI